MPKHHNKTFAQAGINLRRLIGVVGIFIILAIALIVSSNRTALASVTYQALVTPTAQFEAMEENLVYLQIDASGGGQSLVRRPKSDIASSEKSTKSNVFSLSLSERCGVLGLDSVPGGQWVAIDVSCEDGGTVHLVHAKSGKTTLDDFLNQESLFLGWANSHEAVIKIVSGKNAGIYLANTSNGKVELLNMPLETYNVSFSKNGKKMIFVTTRGLGYGSEVWVSDSDGYHAQLVLIDASHIIAHPQFSPNGKQIAYIRMPDSNIPYTIGELWVIDAETLSSRLVAEADAGHGYRPAWSPDGKKIAYVVRENKNDKLADHSANRLLSNISIVNVDTNRISRVTDFSQTMVESPVWSEDGESLAFNASANGVSAVWIFKIPENNLIQVTQDESASYPVWVAIP